MPPSSKQIDYIAAFSTEQGERVLADLMMKYYDRLSFTKDPYETAKREGERSVVLHIKNMMKEKKND